MKTIKSVILLFALLALLLSEACGDKDTPSCTDGIQNGDETSIDCGGSCAPCTGSWQRIHVIMQTYCSAASGCHGATSNTYSVDGTAAEAYAELVNVAPKNPYAKDSLGNKLVVPFSPDSSFLIRKLGHCSSGPLKLKDPDEGNNMPDNGGHNAPPLSTQDLELIYRWIEEGAPETATFNDTIAGDICVL